MKDIGKKIAIIGAGPAGLSIAEALREKGYKNITIFEKSNKPGGQAISFCYNCPSGRKIFYDIGSFGYVGSKRIRKIRKKYNIHLRSPLNFIIYNLAQDQIVFNLNKFKYSFKFLKIIPRLLFDLNKLFYYVFFKYRALLKPGYKNLPYKEELQLSMDKWIQRRNFKYLSDILLLEYGIVSKYGYPERSEPAAAALKVMFQYTTSFYGIFLGKLMPYEFGYQSLWNKLSESHHIIYKSNISKIMRNKDVVFIESDGKKYEFEQLILACPLTSIQSVLDCSEDEKYIFDRIIYSPGWRGAFIAKGLLSQGVVFFEDNLKYHKKALLLFYAMGKVDEEHYLYSAAFTNDLTDPVEKVKSEAQAILCEKLKAQDLEWLRIIKHPFYGAHFSEKDFLFGIYDTLESMQGTNNTFYAGALLSGNLHALVVDYSYDLVARYF